MYHTSADNSIIDLTQAQFCATTGYSFDRGRDNIIMIIALARRMLQETEAAESRHEGLKVSHAQVEVRLQMTFSLDPIWGRMGEDPLHSRLF